MAFDKICATQEAYDYDAQNTKPHSETSVEQVSKLIKAAGNTSNSDDAMRFSQAALNAAKAIETITHAGYSV